MIKKLTNILDHFDWFLLPTSVFTLKLYNKTCSMKRHPPSDGAVDLKNRWRCDRWYYLKICKCHGWSVWEWVSGPFQSVCLCAFEQCSTVIHGDHVWRWRPAWTSPEGLHVLLGSPDHPYTHVSILKSTYAWIEYVLCWNANLLSITFESWQM